jgi:hypothetical protein
MSTLREEVEQSWLAAYPKWQVCEETGDFRTEIVSVSTGKSNITFTREYEVQMTISGLFGFNELDVTSMLITLGVSVQRFGVTDYLAWANRVDHRFSKLLSTHGRRSMLRALAGSDDVFKECFFGEFVYEAAQNGELRTAPVGSLTRPPIVSDLAHSEPDRRSIRLNSLIVELPKGDTGMVLFRLDSPEPNAEWHSLQQWARLLFREVLSDVVKEQTDYLNTNVAKIEIMLTSKHFGLVSSLLERSETIEQRVRRAWESL